MQGKEAPGCELAGAQAKEKTRKAATLPLWASSCVGQGEKHSPHLSTSKQSADPELQACLTLPGLQLLEI